MSSRASGRTPLSAIAMARHKAHLVAQGFSQAYGDVGYFRIQCYT